MKLNTALACYLRSQRALGYRFKSDAVILKAFGRAVGWRPLGQIRSGQVRAYLQGKGPLTSFWHRKWVSLRGFFDFALVRGWVGASPVPDRAPRLGPPFVPYIFSRQELQRLFVGFEDADARRVVSNATLQMLLRLLYGAGLRLSEALHLHWTDVDWENGVLTIREAKFFKTRWVPLAPALLAELRRYLRQQERDPTATGLPVLTNQHAHALTCQQAERAFRQLRQQARIHRPAAVRYQPRLHDLRHSFAVHRLIQWYQQGADVQRLLPALSTYLGHRSLSATQRYLTMTPQLLTLAAERFAAYASVP